jgi:hypothetical protein
MRFFSIFFILFLFLSPLGHAKNIQPKKNLSAKEVILIQLNALKNNDQNDSGIEQTWLFAHPKNKLATGPYDRFKKMLYDPHYVILLNHYSHQLSLINSKETEKIYEIKITTKDQRHFFYEWKVEIGSEKNCKSCWFTSAVSFPEIKGKNI